MRVLWEAQMSRVVHQLESQQGTINAGRTQAQSMENQLGSHAAALREMSGNIQSLVGQLQQTNALLNQVMSSMSHPGSHQQGASPASAPTHVPSTGFMAAASAPTTTSKPAMPDAVAKLLAQARPSGSPQNPFAPAALAGYSAMPGGVSGAPMNQGAPSFQAQVLPQPQPQFSSIPMMPSDIYSLATYAPRAGPPAGNPQLMGCKLPGMSISNAPLPQNPATSTQFQFSLGPQHPSAPPAMATQAVAQGTNPTPAQLFLGMPRGASR